MVESCSFKHDINEKGKGKGQRDRASSPSPEPRSQSKDIKDGNGAAKGKVPKGTSLPVTKANFTFQISEWKSARSRHAMIVIRPNVLSTKTDEGFKFVEKCAFLHSDNEAPSRKSKKKDQKCDKRRQLQLCVVIKNWVVYLRTSNCRNKRLDLRT